MTFEEFFTKKRIDLVALNAAEPALFLEFEKHFEQMGEKSFDHTKKYWFNKLRLLYHLAPELKPEKMHLENQLAEQTIVETLTDSIPVAATGFKPRFKAGAIAKPVASSDEQAETPVENTASTEAKEPTTKESSENIAPKSGFKPRFKAGVTAKAAEPTTDETEPSVENTEVKEQPAEKAPENTAPKPGFKPRFNMKMAAPKPADTEDAKPETEPEKGSAPAEEATAPKPGFKPRFNMKTMAAKPAEDATQAQENTEQVKEEKVETPEPIQPQEVPVTPKPGFKTRFNMKMVAPKPAEAGEGKPVVAEQVTVQAEPEAEKQPPVEDAPVKPKIGFKPRFNAKTTKPQQPEE